MTELLHPLCLLKSIWRSLMRRAWVSGHDFATSAEPTPANVHVLECARCGAVSVGWSFESLEGVK